MDDITIRPVTEDEYPAFVAAFMEGFSDDVPSDSFAAHIQATLPPERTLAAFDGEAMVGTFGGYDLLLTVPGGSMRMEGTTVVTVHATHRRRGLLREMMRVHLDNAAAAGYPIAGLWASETDIYGRYGYGIAARSMSIEMMSRDIVFRDEVTVDRVRKVSAAEAADIVPPAFDRLCAATPGMLARTPAWWEHSVFPDEDWMRSGRTKRRYVVHDGPSGVDGYASYRMKYAESADGHDGGEVAVVEFIAATPSAEASLWSYLTHIDGRPKVEAWNVSLGSSLPAMIREPRRIKIKRVYDTLWIRILDVGAALTGRTYEEDGAVTFSLHDPFRPETDGSYRLTVDDGTATVEVLDEGSVVDLAMEVDVLGALLIGGADARAYAAANRITGDARAVTTLHRLFRTVSPPWIDAVF